MCLKIIYLIYMLWYHPNFRYTMDSSNKDITFDRNPLGKLVLKLNW